MSMCLCQAKENFQAKLSLCCIVSACIQKWYIALVLLCFSTFLPIACPAHEGTIHWLMKVSKTNLIAPCISQKKKKKKSLNQNFNLNWDANEGVRPIARTIMLKVSNDR